MQTHSDSAPPPKGGGTDAGAATRQRFVDAAIAHLVGTFDAAASEVGRRTTTSDTAQQKATDRRTPEPLGIRLVAQLAGATHAGPLYYFPDRTCLLAAVAAEGFRLLRGVLEQPQRPPAGLCMLDVVDDALRYVEWASEHPALFTTMYDPSLAAGLELLQLTQLAGGSPIVRFGNRYGGGKRAIARRVEAFEELLAGKRAILGFFRNSVDSAIARGELRANRSLERITYAITSMANGLAWQRVTEPQILPELRWHAQECLGLLLEGIAAKED